jgi:threonine aldolase
MQGSAGIADFRSDTVTRPTPGMLEAMFRAKVGDDVFEDDPTVNHLEEKAAAMFGKEAALFCASGTMTNQIAIKIHTRPGDEVICEKNAHVYAFEGGGIAFNSGASVRLIDGDRGRINALQVENCINADNVHFPVSSLVAVENTANRGGGSIYNFADIQDIRLLCNTHNLGLHLDGARLFNALVETGESPKQYGDVFDTISICLSKGLGAPVGSLLLGTKAMIKKARRVRKVMGGGWRQAGYLAAAGVYALDHHISRLKEDHDRAAKLHEVLSRMDYVAELMPQETNIVIFKLNERISDIDFLKKLEAENIRISGMGKQSVRIVTHLDIDDEMIDRTIQVMESLNSTR